jgi:hypothetical protein
MSRRMPRIAMIALLAGLLGSFAIARPAYSRVFIGFGFPLVVGPPVFYPPPVYYPPPAFYPPAPFYPPPAYAPGPQADYAPPQGGQSCSAGPLMCPMERPVSAGSSCYCHDRNGQRVWGHAT